MILIVEEGWISGFTVEGGKSDFYNSRGWGGVDFYTFFVNALAALVPTRATPSVRASSRV